MEGLSICLTFLEFEFRLSALGNKTPTAETEKEVREWIGSKSCKWKELESLVGCLCHASRAIKPGKTFMHLLFEVLVGACQSHHHVCLGLAIRLDILWWHTFIDEWNGVS